MCLVRALCLALPLLGSAGNTDAAQSNLVDSVYSNSAAISGCTVGIVGAGWSGVYWAWRLGVDTRTIPASGICIFEAFARFGGRTYTVQEASSDGSFVSIDVGAYRFAGDMHLPADLIMHALDMRTSCYDPECKDNESLPSWPYKEPLRKVVDEEGRNVGYQAPMRQMLEQLLAAGGRLLRGHRLVGASLAEGGRAPPAPEGLRLSSRAVTLRFANKRQATVHLAMLNLPRQVVMGIDGLPEMMVPRTHQVISCHRSDFLTLKPPLLHSSASNFSGGVKAYAYYEDAWWLSKLGLTRGSLRSEVAQPPLAIRYHDGPVECARGVDVADNTIWGPPVAGGRCRGALQVVYDFFNVDWWLKLQKRRDEPMTLLRDPKVLDTVHRRLLRAHGRLLQQAEVDPESLPSPQWIALGTWVKDPAVLQPSPAKVIYAGGDAGLASTCGIPGLTAIEYAERVVNPVDPEVWLANNDFHAQAADAFDGDWAQDSLLLAERALHRLGVRKPAWLNGTYYDRRIVNAEVDPAQPAGARHRGLGSPVLV